jgi:thiazole tautomerase (transcriptional regulator TenI)
VDARTVFQIGWIGRSVHSVDEAKMAVDAGADYVVAGPVFETPTHPGMTPWGISLIQKVSQLNLPVIAIGGMTPERSQHVFEAGAWGVAAISALWKTVKPAEAASQMLQPWM